MNDTAWFEKNVESFRRVKGGFEFLTIEGFGIVDVSLSACIQQAKRLHGDDVCALVATDKLIAYADGACSGNPGVGGWGVYIPAQGIELKGGDKYSTSNKMELTAAIKALENSVGAIEIRSDSQYVVKGMTSWIKGWVKNGWKTADRGEVKNAELWKKLLELVSGREVHWVWVKGHNGDPGNEKADQLAVEGRNSV